MTLMRLSTRTIISNSMERSYPEFTNTLITVRFYQIGYSFTFLLGFLGNTASLLTFSRPALRKVSTGCLFIALAISDVLYLLTCVIDFLEFGLNIPFYPHIAYSAFCRFRTFIMYATQLASAWILVIVSIDRWIRTRFPFKSGSICTPKKALIAVAVILVIDIGLHSHILTPMFGMLVPGFANGACGPDFNNNDAYLIFYYRQWTIVQIMTNSLIPAILMLIILIDIRINTYLRKRILVQPVPIIQGNPNAHRQGHLQKQMFILMLASICIFFITTLPVNLYKIIASQTNNIEDIALQVSTIWTALGWFQSLNQAINFYMHCLSSTLFRKEFLEKMKSIFRRNRTQLDVFTAAKRTEQLRKSHP